MSYHISGFDHVRLYLSALCCRLLRTPHVAHVIFVLRLSLSANIKKPVWRACPKASAPPTAWACDWDTFTIKCVGGEEKKIIRVSGRPNEKIGERGGCHETCQKLFTLTSTLLPHPALFSSAVGHFSFKLFVSVLSSCHSQMNSMNSVSSSEDIKPPPGLQNLGNINYQCTSPGGMSKHICAICGDRSSGNNKGFGWRRGTGKLIYTPTHHKHPLPHEDK